MGDNRGFRRSNGTHIDNNTDHDRLALAPAVLLEGTGGDSVYVSTWVSRSLKALQERVYRLTLAASSHSPSCMPHT